MADRTHFIQANETLLILDATRTGSQYVGESTTFGREYQIDHILDEPDDSCFRIIRWNVETLQSDDVTEQMAGAWLARYSDEQDSQGFELEASDERAFPQYVKASEAWATVRDSLQPRRPQVYNATRPHSTLDAVTQGLRHG